MEFQFIIGITVYAYAYVGEYNTRSNHCRSPPPPNLAGVIAFTGIAAAFFVGKAIVGANTASVSSESLQNTVVATITLISGDGTPSAIAITNNFAYVTDDNNGGIPSSQLVSIINLTTNTVLPATITVGNNPVDIAINTAGTLAYVSNLNGSSISVINLADNTSQTIPGFNSPDGIAINSTGTFAYVVNNTGNSVSVVNLATNDIVPPAITVGLSPINITITTNPSGTFAYVTNARDNTVSVINLQTNAVQGPAIGVGNTPQGIAINPAGTFAYICNSGNGTVSVINLATNTVFTTITVGTGPSRIAINPAGTFAYATNFTDGTVSVINLGTNTVVQTITVGTNPRGIAINSAGTFAYVCNNGSGTVSVIAL